jgi:hypothetical protein
MDRMELAWEIRKNLFHAYGEYCHSVLSADGGSRPLLTECPGEDADCCERAFLDGIRRSGDDPSPARAVIACRVIRRRRILRDVRDATTA